MGFSFSGQIRLFWGILLIFMGSALALAPPDQTPLLHLGDQVQDLSFYDHLTKKGKARPYRLFRTHPELPTQETCWRTIYFYHGLTGTHQSYPMLPAILDSLSRDHGWPPIQLVQLNSNVGHATGSFYTNSSLYGPYYELVHEYFPKYMIKHHQACAEPQKTYLMGHSMGAFGAAKLLLDSTKTYAGVALHSGPLDLINLPDFQGKVMREHQRKGYSAFDPTSGKTSLMLYCMAGAFSPNTSKLYQVQLPFDLEGGVDSEVQALWRAHSPRHRLQDLDQGDFLHQTKIWLDVGSEDHLNLTTPNELFHQALQQHRVPHHFEVYPGGHGNKLSERFGLSLIYLLQDARDSKEQF